MIGEQTLVGCYATVYVEANDPKEAERCALAKLQAEPQMQPPSGCPTPNNARAYLVDISLVYDGGVSNRKTQIAWFPMQSKAFPLVLTVGQAPQDAQTVPLYIRQVEQALRESYPRHEGFKVAVNTVCMDRQKEGLIDIYCHSGWTGGFKVAFEFPSDQRHRVSFNVLPDSRAFQLGCGLSLLIGLFINIAILTAARPRWGIELFVGGVILAVPIFVVVYPAIRIFAPLLRMSGKQFSQSDLDRVVALVYRATST
jgi:hypothetical protein